jgi:hypothetical protein
MPTDVHPIPLPAQICTTFQQAADDTPVEVEPVRNVAECLIAQVVTDAQIQASVAAGESLLSADQFYFHDSISLLEGAKCNVRYAWLKNIELLQCITPTQKRRLTPGADFDVRNAFLNGFHGGVGIPLIGDKIEHCVELFKAKSFNKFDCFCLDAPYQIDIYITGAGLTAFPLQLSYDIVLGAEGRVWVPPVPVKEVVGDSDRSDRCNDWNDKQKPKCLNPCCPDNPCGKIKGKCVSEGSILVNGFAELVTIPVGAAQPGFPFTSYFWQVPLCQGCRGKLLTNAFCVTARVLTPEQSPNLAAAKLLLPGLADDQSDWPNSSITIPQSIPLAIGQGVQAILSALDATLSNADVNAAWCFDQFLYQVPGQLNAELRLFPDPGALATIYQVLFSIAYVTHVNCPEPQ